MAIVCTIVSGFVFQAALKEPDQHKALLLAICSVGLFAFSGLCHVAEEVRKPRK